MSRQAARDQGRRKQLYPNRDRAKHRREWRALAEDALAASRKPEEANPRLVEKATLARKAWDHVAEPPEGGLCEQLAVDAQRYARQRNRDIREKLAPGLAAIADVVLTLIDVEEARAAQTSALAQARLPYKESDDE